MIDLLREKISSYSTNEDKYNFLREYLQLLILKIMDEQGFFNKISFLGGTALRILYDLNRYSEDLDFNLLNQENYDFQLMMNKIQRELELLGLNLSIQTKAQRTVAIAKIKFSNLLFELGISQLKDQNLMIKFEVDQNPPSDFNTELTLINKEFLLSIGHLDLPSMYSGKLLAILCRKYVKGRDYYDLLWYLAKKIQPNWNYLNSGLEQHNFVRCKTIESMKELLVQKLESTDFKTVLADLEPFLIDSKEKRFFTRDNFINLVQSI